MEALCAANHLLFRVMAIKCSGLLGADLQRTMRRRASVEMGRGSLRVQCTPGAGSPARGRRADERQRSQMMAQRRHLLRSSAMEAEKALSCVGH